MIWCLLCQYKHQLLERIYQRIGRLNPYMRYLRLCMLKAKLHERFTQLHCTLSRDTMRMYEQAVQDAWNDLNPDIIHSP